ncbi:hypothetical protein O3M35_008962 [Rhynocoris fuscipes]|uniref:Chitin-binding type-2 domain-containing protein n=1 Tax=Rhynocoris fuscipes TaxID=488301 RepID=A0AAW1D3Y6_9HEMI
MMEEEIMNESEVLEAKERLKRLIPYMTYYVNQNGGQHRTVQRPVFAVATTKEAASSYLSSSFPHHHYQPSAVSAASPTQQSYLVPVVVPSQQQQYHRQQPLSNNYQRFLIQQPSALTKMITQNYLSIGKQHQQQQYDGRPRIPTRLNTYSPQNKHSIATDHSVPLKQHYTGDQQPQILYKQQQQQRPFTYKQLQDPISYEDEESSVIYKTNSEENNSDELNYYNKAPEQVSINQHHKVAPELLAQFKLQDAIVPPLQYKKLIASQDIPGKQYYVLTRRPTVAPVTSLTQNTAKPILAQHHYNDDKDDSVTITQSQEIDVSTLAEPKYQTKYVTAKPNVVTIPRKEHHYPVNYHQHDEYDSVPLSDHQHQNDDSIEQQDIDQQQQAVLDDHIGAADDDVDGQFNNILGGFSLAKSLPEKITAENLDSSIKTLSKLLRILQRANALPHSAKTLVSNLPRNKDHPLSVKVSKISPKIAHSDDDSGTPGRAGIDYPAYDEIPETHFSCKEQRYKGFFGDPETGCQVWHYCDLNGGQASFLCPNGTIFSQVALTCDWWFNVKCASTSQLYVLNERLYKYILPQKLSFPEDYQGPLVDQYLELKFKEIEEKNRNKTEEAKKNSKAKDGDEEEEEEEEKEYELPFSEDKATSLNQVRSIKS